MDLNPDSRHSNHSCTTTATTPTTATTGSTPATARPRGHIWSTRLKGWVVPITRRESRRPSPQHVFCSEPPCWLLMEPIAQPGAENSRFPSPYRQCLPLLTPVLLHHPTMASSSFSAEQIASLSAPLDRANVRQREQGRIKLSYLEGWHVIAEANRIFGFDGWQRETIEVRCVHQAERPINVRGGREQKAGWGVTYTARVRITVGTPDSAAVIREGCGAGHGIDTDLGQAHESALKEAETDGMKRALMTFGSQFGLALYDPQQREVTGPAAGEERGPAAQGDGGQLPVARSGHSQRHSNQAEQSRQPEHPAAKQADPALAPLNPATIEQLHTSIRSLPRPALEELIRAFRKRFQIPAEAPSIANRILQKHHQEWIEAFLARQQARRTALQHA